MNENNYQNQGPTYHANGDGTWSSTNNSGYNSYSNNGASNSSSYGSYGNTANGNNSYGNNSYGSNSYGNNAYGNSAYNSAAYGNAAYTKQPRQKKKKDPNRFSVKLAKCVAIALVFGLVAGATFTGVQYGLGKTFGISTIVGDKDKENSSIAVSNTSVGKAVQLTDVSGLVQEAMKACVSITNTYTYTSQGFFGMGGQSYEATSCGTGVIISQDEKYLYIASNNHVVEDAEALTVQFCDESTVAAEVKGTDASSDLAVVKVELSSISDETLNKIKTATIGDASSVLVGNACIAIGNALGYGQSVTTGVVSALNRSISVQDESTGAISTYSGLIQTDAAINPGNSGGALLNANGEVIGINSAKYSDTNVEGVGYAISMTDALPIIQQLITQEKVEEARAGYLGIQGYDVSEDVASKYGLPKGVYVYQALAGKGAQAAGIESGDVITGINGTQITSMTELQEKLSYCAEGDVVTVSVAKRANNYQEAEVQVTLSGKN